MLWITIILVVLISLLIVERFVVSRCVRQLEMRIHVNGTRGKSSVSEYIAAGLNSSGIDVLAKITGIIPTVIHNGEATAIKRTGAARVQEQLDIIRLAARKKVRAVVLECMSIAPDLQKLESRWFKPHIYVITNIRDDHREEMGSGIEEQANSICEAIPQNCIVITNEVQFLDKIKDVASRKNCSVLSSQNHPDADFENLPDGAIEENISLALSVCKAAGIDHHKAATGIKACVSCKTSLLISISSEKKTIRFLNAFAANDVESTIKLLEHWKGLTGYDKKVSILFNTRSDRPLRTDLFSRWIGSSSWTLDKIIITGSHSARARNFLKSAGIDSERVYLWNRKEISNLKENLLNIFHDGTIVMGIGNIAGDGLSIINKLS